MQSQVVLLPIDGIRWRVVWKRIIKELSFVEIARNLNIAVGTTHNIWIRFILTGEVSAKKQPPRYSKRKLDDYQEVLLIGLIMELYISEIQQYILCNAGVQVSSATICRVLKKYGLTSRQIS